MVDVILYPMESQEWVTVKFRRPLYEKIRSAIENIKEMGVQKYDSVPDFAQTASILLLEKEGIRD